MLKDIEEIRPNLFLKKTKRGYRQVFPMHKDINKPLSWNNIHWKRTLIGNPEFFFTILSFIVIILLLCVAYSHDIVECKKLIEKGGNTFEWNSSILKQENDFGEYQQLIYDYKDEV